MLTRLDLAFSRDQRPKVYVQHRMREPAAELFAWLEEGAYVYVCGDARRMAPDVDRALRELVATHGGRATSRLRLPRQARRLRPLPARCLLRPEHQSP